MYYLKLLSKYICQYNIYVFFRISKINLLLKLFILINSLEQHSHIKLDACIGIHLCLSFIILHMSDEKKMDILF